MGIICISLSCLNVIRKEIRLRKQNSKEVTEPYPETAPPIHGFSPTFLSLVGENLRIHLHLFVRTALSGNFSGKAHHYNRNNKGDQAKHQYRNGSAGNTFPFAGNHANDIAEYNYAAE